MAARWLRAGLIRCDGGKPYLARVVFFERVRLHLFLHGDTGPHHDHSYDFWAVALFGMAREEVRFAMLDGMGSGVLERRIWPLVPRFYRARNAHRILRPRWLVTLVVNGPYHRRWGFWRGGTFEAHDAGGCR